MGDNKTNNEQQTATPIGMTAAAACSAATSACVSSLHAYVCICVCICKYTQDGARVCICMFGILVFWPACLYFCFDAASSRSLSSTKFGPRTAAKKSSSPNAARSQARTQTKVHTPTQTRIARSNSLGSNHIQPVLPTLNGKKGESDGKQREKPLT